MGGKEEETLVNKQFQPNAKTPKHARKIPPAAQPELTPVLDPSAAAAFA